MVLFAEISRPLVHQDLAVEPAESERRAPNRKRLSDRHHRLARLLAEGIPPGQAAVACGLTGPTVSILQADPSFAELTLFYRQQVNAEFRGTATKLAEIAGLAAEEIIVRLEENPEEMEMETLQTLLKLAADRTGHAPQPKSASVNVTMNIGERLEAASRRLCIEGTAKEIKE